jgi:hypothetical protein
MKFLMVSIVLVVHVMISFAYHHQFLAQEITIIKGLK